MRSAYSAALDAMCRIRGVSGAMIVGESDGLVVDATLQPGVRGDVIAALSASLYRRAKTAATAAGLGPITFLQLDAAEGRIFAAGAGDLVLVAIAESRANVGLIRMEMLREAEAAR